MKTLDELAASLVFEGEDGALTPKQLSHAYDLLKRQPRLVEVLREPLEFGPCDPGLSNLAAQAAESGVGTVVEFPLSQPQSLNSRFDMRLGAYRMGVRAVSTAQVVRDYPHAVVISSGRGELCVERSLFRVVCKLLWFRVKEWWRKHA